MRPVPPPMLPVIRVWACNVPESGKRGLLRPARNRAPRVLNFANRRKATVVGAQEAGKNLQRTARKRPHWAAHFAKPNSRAWGNRQGNAILVKTRQARIVDRTQITVAGLHTPVALLDRNGYRFVVISAHVPTGRVGIVARTAYNDGLAGYLALLEDVPVVLLADSNSGAGWVKPLPGVRLVHRHHVDVIAASAHFAVRRRWTVRRPQLSDHAFIGAALKARRQGIRLDRLPKG